MSKSCSLYLDAVQYGCQAFHSKGWLLQNLFSKKLDEWAQLSSRSHEMVQFSAVRTAPDCLHQVFSRVPPFYTSLVRYFSYPSSIKPRCSSQCRQVRMQPKVVWLSPTHPLPLHMRKQLPSVTHRKASPLLGSINVFPFIRNQIWGLYVRLKLTAF